MAATQLGPSYAFDTERIKERPQGLGKMFVLRSGTWKIPLFVHVASRKHTAIQVKILRPVKQRFYHMLFGGQGCFCSLASGKTAKFDETHAFANKSRPNPQPVGWNEAGYPTMLPKARVTLLPSVLYLCLMHTSSYVFICSVACSNAMLHVG